MEYLVDVSGLAAQVVRIEFDPGPGIVAAVIVCVLPKRHAQKLEIVHTHDSAGFAVSLDGKDREQDNANPEGD